MERKQPVNETNTVPWKEPAPRNASCVITYTVSGLTSSAERAEASARLWASIPKGPDSYFPLSGPRVEGGKVIYSIHTTWRGEEAEIQSAQTLEHSTGGSVSFIRSDVPPAPAPLPGVDAPAPVKPGEVTA